MNRDFSFSPERFSFGHGLLMPHIKPAPAHPAVTRGGICKKSRNVRANRKEVSKEYGMNFQPNPAMCLDKSGRFFLGRGEVNGWDHSYAVVP